jgi:chromosome segregation ATPase
MFDGRVFSQDTGLRYGRSPLIFMIRDLMLLPVAPGRLLDDLGEMKKLMRELLHTEEELTRTCKSMDAKMSKLDVANERLDRALDELHGFNEKVDRLDARIARVERELAVIRGGMEEVAQIVPELGKGPLEKAKQALTGE